MQVRRGGDCSKSNAEPMSMILALPVRLSMMFDGFRSPWTMPSRCRAASAGQAVADDGDGDARLQPRLHRPGRDDHLVDVVPALAARRAPEPFEHVAGQQPAQVVAVDPFHLHHADAAAVHPVVDVQQVVLLDLGDAGGDLGHPAPSPRRTTARLS